MDKDTLPDKAKRQPPEPSQVLPNTMPDTEDVIERSLNPKTRQAIKDILKTGWGHPRR